MIIVLGLIILVAALIAGVIAAGGLGGGWAATRLPFPRPLTLHGPVNLPAWLTAIAGAAIVLPACHLATGRAGHRMAPR